MRETKASRLKQLSDVVNVPDFFVVDRGGDFQKDLDDLDSEKKYMVRSSSNKEDTKSASRAGRYPTIGPIRLGKVRRAIKKVFSDKRVDQVIVQEFISASEYGVTFCFSRESAFVEYSEVFEGVTSGSVNPFVAVLPAKLKRYKNLKREVFRIFDRFGPCDIEFAGLKNPAFVQVRPITELFNVDEDLENLKMNLQELEEEKWIKDDLCEVAGERSASDEHFFEMYFKALKNVQKKFFKRDLKFNKKQVLKIDGQYFIPRKLHDLIVPKFGHLLLVGLFYSREFKRVKNDFGKSIPLVKLFENNILLSYWYELFKKREIFDWRMKYREKIDSQLEKKQMKVDFPIKKHLDSEIVFDSSRKTWKSIGYLESEGTVIVPGDFETGPFFFLKNPIQKIPKGVVVLTKQLYPEIGASIRDIKGIVCENGSISSHISILAREYDVPLMIQTQINI